MVGDGNNRLLRDGRDEMNLSEFPIAALSDRGRQGETTLEFSREERDPTTKEWVTRKLTVEGSRKYGVPTAKDEEVALGLIQLTKIKNGFETPLVRFSQLELLRLLGWGTESSDYRRLGKAFDRLVAVRFHYENSWRDNAKKTYETKGGFGLIQSYELRDSRRGPKRQTANTSDTCVCLSEFEWTSTFFRSFQDGYLKKLDYATVRKLKVPIATRLYRYLDKHFYPAKGRLRLEFDLKTLAFETLGMSRSYDKAGIVRQLNPAIEELEGIGFIRQMLKKQRYYRVGKKWIVIFEMACKERNGRANLVATNRNQKHQKQARTKPKAEDNQERVAKFMESLGSDKERREFEEQAVKHAPQLREAYLQAKAHGTKTFEAYRVAILNRQIDRILQQDRESTGD